MSQIDTKLDSRLVPDGSPLFGTIERVRILSGCILCLVLMYCVSRHFSMPTLPGVSPSLLQERGAVLDILILLFTLAACVVIGTILAGSIRFEAGLFCAAIGLTALPARSGPMRYALMNSASPAVFASLAMELILLFGVMLGAWWVLWLLHRAGMLRPDPISSARQMGTPLGQKLPATVAHIVVMVLCMLLLSQTDSPKQSILAVGLSAIAAAVAAFSMFPVRPSVWYWLGPLGTGLIGYGWSFFVPGDRAIGIASQGLARATPLDYASAGVAGAILGYWIANNWVRAAEPPGAPASNVSPASQGAGSPSAGSQRTT